MQLFVRASRTLVLELDPADAAVHHVKRQVHEILGVPPCEQRLVHAGKQLEDWRALDECGVASGSTVHLLLRVRGGCPPDRCCCWDLHTGMRRVTLFFLLLMVIRLVFLIVAIVTLSALCLSDTIDDCEEQASAIIATVIAGLVVAVASIVLLAYGHSAIANSSADALGCYWKVLALLLALQCASIAVRGALALAVQPSAAIEMPIQLVLTVALGGWYVLGAVSLQRKIASGDIDAGRPEQTQPA